MLYVVLYSVNTTHTSMLFFELVILAYKKVCENRNTNENIIRKESENEQRNVITEQYSVNMYSVGSHKF